MSEGAFHETFAREHEVEASSERSFGIVFSAFFLLVAVWRVWGGREVRWWAAAIAVALFTIALVRPSLLRPLNRVWLRLGMLLNRIVSPLVMALIFIVTVTPIALIMRLSGKDPLRLRLEPQAKSYWIERKPPGPAPETMINQF